MTASCARYAMYAPFYRDTYDGVHGGMTGRNIGTKPPTHPNPRSKPSCRRPESGRRHHHIQRRSVLHQRSPPITYTEVASGRFIIDTQTMPFNHRRSFFNEKPNHPTLYSRFYKSKCFCDTCHDISSSVLINQGTDLLITCCKGADQLLHDKRI